MSPPDRPMLKITVPAEQSEELSWDLADAGATAVEERDGTTMAAAAGAKVTELYAGFEDRAARDRAARQLSETYNDLELEPIDHVDDGWQHKWREFFRPVILERLQVVTPWMDVPAGDRLPIVIDPGMAFGTGGHATTRLILQMLERRASKGDLPSPILDVGTGSGVLAIAALKLGAAEVLGIDIEAESIEAAEENAGRNGIDTGFACRKATAADLDGGWPLVLANLQLDVFWTAAPDVAARVAPGGAVLVSGVLAEQVDRCLALWPGFTPEERLEEEGWAALALRRG